MEFADVLKEELKSITERRRRVRALAPQPPPRATGQEPEPTAPNPADQPPASANPSDATPLEKQMRLEAMDRHLAGLALSGGGIRSATFALGVLQGLATLKILNRFDYLSTVSGGGYIGGWLAAWLKREGDPFSVEDQLEPSRIPRPNTNLQVIGTNQIVDEEPEPIHHLRAFSNYLTPRPGLLTVDTWTILTIYVRNALINMLLLLPAIMIIVLASRCIVQFYVGNDPDNFARYLVLALLAILLAISFLALAWQVWILLDVGADKSADSQQSKAQDQTLSVVAATIISPLLLAAVLAGWSFSRGHGPVPPSAPPLTRLPDGVWDLIKKDFVDRDSPIQRIFNDNLKNEHVVVNGQFMAYLFYALAFGLLALLAHVLGYFLFLAFARQSRKAAQTDGQDPHALLGVLRMWVAALVAGSTGGILFFALLSKVFWPLKGQFQAIITVGPPLALLVVVAGTFVEVWLLARWQGDNLREWWARTCAWLVIVAAAWFAFFGLTLYGPMLVSVYGSQWPRVQLGTLFGWLATALSGALAGQKVGPKPTGGSAWWLKPLVAVAPLVFVAGLLVIVAMLVDALVFDPKGSPSNASPEEYWTALASTGTSRILVSMIGCFALVVVSMLMSNVNLFSLNSMYANRLTRCYLGASRPKREWYRRGKHWLAGTSGAPTAARGPVRRENPFTGFDPEDDLALWTLKIGSQNADYLGPHLIMNTSLNLVAGSELAWQNREAESFILTPEHSGSKGTGYVATTQATGRELTLGRAMSISGAAVDSNIGIHQSSALIALMTALNARLGWWILNPNPTTWRNSWRPPAQWDARGPSAAYPLLWELLGQTDANKKWVHLSDGGHFENLGVYELVRRRCRYIVCTDAGVDPAASDDNLANMIRLCRIDFGVRIEIDTTPLAPQGSERFSQWHCAVGKIRYDDVDGGERPGIFVLLRTLLTGDEPPDVQEYATKNPTFPQESTANQFFTESQFESYRALGYHVALTTFVDALNDVKPVNYARTGDQYTDVANPEPLWFYRDPEIEFKRGNQRLFSALQRRWAQAPPIRKPSSSSAVQSWIQFQQALGREPDLAPLSLEIYPERSAAASSGISIAQWHAVTEMLEVMETAWADIRMSDPNDLPTNRGWMSLFRRWTTTPTLRRLWPVLRGEYSPDFVKYCESQLQLGARFGIIPRTGHETFFDIAKTIIGDEFAREWPQEKTLDLLMTDAEHTWPSPRPVSLIIMAPTGGGSIAESPDKFPCGIVFASRIPPDPDATSTASPRFEIFIWMRRAYRGMGIASRCSRQILLDFLKTPQGQHSARPFTLQTRYPAKPTDDPDGRKDEIDYNLWLNFFSHYDFRSPRGTPRIKNGYWVIERTFTDSDIEL